MSELKIDQPRGALRRGWSATVSDYAIAGGWVRGGKAMVVGDAAGSVYAFDSKRGTTVWEKHEVHEGGMLAMAIHPKGDMFATAGQDGRVLVWNAISGRISQTIEVGSGWVENVAWSSDGRLAASLSRRVHVYDADSAEVWRSDEHPSTVSAIAWCSAEELATACYGRVTFFDASTGELRQKLEWKGSLVSMVLSPNGGDIVACGSQDNSVHFWRRSTGKDSMMSGYPNKPSALGFDHTGILLATNGANDVTVWSFEGDGPEGTRPFVLEFHTLPVTKLSFAPRGMRLASGGRDCTVVVWSLRKDGEGQPIGVALLKGVVAELCWRPDGRGLVALDAQGGVTAWRVG